MTTDQINLLAAIIASPEERSGEVMSEPLEAKKMTSLICFPRESLLFAEGAMDQWLVRHLMALPFEWPRPVKQCEPEPVADEPIIVGDVAQFCEHCGKDEPLSEFSGWRQDIGEYLMLCSECHSNATMEE